MVRLRSGLPQISQNTQKFIAEKELPQNSQNTQKFIAEKEFPQNSQKFITEKKLPQRTLRGCTCLKCTPWKAEVYC